MGHRTPRRPPPSRFRAVFEPPSRRCENASERLVAIVIRQKRAGAIVLGVVDDLASRPLLHDDTAVHEDEVIGHIAGEAHLMGDNDHGHVLGRQIADDLQHLAGQLRIQRARGLVEEQHVRVHGHGPGDGHTLLLTAG